MRAAWSRFLHVLCRIRASILISPLTGSIIYLQQHVMASQLVNTLKGLIKDASLSWSWHDSRNNQPFINSHHWWSIVLWTGLTPIVKCPWLSLAFCLPDRLEPTTLLDCKSLIITEYLIHWLNAKHRQTHDYWLFICASLLVLCLLVLHLWSDILIICAHERCQGYSLNSMFSLI